MSSKRWLADYKDGVAITVPVDDKIEHDNFSTTCHCEPTVEILDNGILIVHRSFDFREIEEVMNAVV